MKYSDGHLLRPIYANLFVGWWEKQVAWAVTNERWTQRVVRWNRYINDLFIVFEGSEQLAREYIAVLNENNLNLKFSGEISSS